MEYPDWEFTAGLRVEIEIFTVARVGFRSHWNTGERSGWRVLKIATETVSSWPTRRWHAWAGSKSCNSYSRPNLHGGKSFEANRNTSDPNKLSYRVKKMRSHLPSIRKFIIAFAIILLQFELHRLRAENIFPGWVAKPELVEEFKGLMEHPPVVGKLVFRVKSPLGQPGVDDEGFQTFYAKWQDNAFILQQLTVLDYASGEKSSPKKFDPGLINAGRFDNYYWFVAANNFQEWTDIGEYGNEKSNLVFSVNKRICGSIGDVLNFGVRNAAIGSIKWKGSTFDAVSETDASIKIKGTLVSAEGKPSKMILKYGPFDWLVTYYYERPFGMACLPSRWTLQTYNKGTPVLVSEVRILEFELMASKSDNKAAFLAGNVPFLSQVGNRIVLTNKQAYVLSSNGLAEAKVGLPLPQFTASNREFSHHAMRVLLGVVLMSPLAYFLIQRIKAQKK